MPFRYYQWIIAIQVFNNTTYTMTDDIMQIFSRHGKLIKTVTENDLLPGDNGNNAVWDGKMEDGSDAEDGTYFYMIEVVHAGQKYQYKNYLELIRADPNL